MLYAFEQLGDVRGKRILEIGAGMGWAAIVLAHRGAQVVATDVSRVGLDIAQQRIDKSGVAGSVCVEVAAAERLDYPDASFDAIFGRAVLHHLDLESAAAEMARVLKPGGRAVFLEPLSENPILDLVRDYVPYPGKKSPVGHRGVTYPLIREGGKPFARDDVREFYLTSMLNRAFGHDTSLRPLERFDDWLLRRVRPLRRYCRYCVVTYVKSA
jgi:SAM-dependent methyltransferase